MLYSLISLVTLALIVVVLIKILTPMRGATSPTGRHICPHCGTRGEPATLTRGSILIEIVAWLAFLVPGLIYSIWRHTTRYPACPACAAPGMIPVNTPTGRALAQQYAPAATPAETPAQPTPHAIATSQAPGSPQPGTYWVKNCPACGAINNPAFATCQRCNAPLAAGKTASDTPPPPIGPGRTLTRVANTGPGAGAVLTAAALLAVLTAVAFAAWSRHQAAEASRAHARAELAAHRKTLSEITTLREISQDTAATFKLASSTSRIALAGPVQKLQDLQSTTRKMRPATGCAETARSPIERHIEGVVGVFLEFMADSKSEPAPERIDSLIADLSVAVDAINLCQTHTEAEIKRLTPLASE